MLKSSYLKDNRLADVLAALQVMAVTTEYSMTCRDWAVKISNDKDKLEYWKTIFQEHPEFFRISEESITGNDGYALIWRRALERYNVETHKCITLAEYRALSDQEKRKINRPPLSESQIKTLMDMAINLHGRAIEASRDWRWWIAPAVSFGGSFLGALMAFTAAALFKR